MKQRNNGYGIYLGAEHASIAYADGTSITILKNNEDQESTPSAVYIDRNNALIVGRKAKNRVESDPDNAFQEFMRQMGTGFEYVFQRSGRRMKPEELSAEVLKTLLTCVQQRTGHRPDAAVITVPAAFGLDQCSATKRAAELAGLRETALLTEPVAAALAYGFQNERDGVYWLVYDFGGGTFEATLITMRGGMIEVVAHAGDKFLGVTDIAWAIVDELLIPAVTQQFQVTDFGRKKAKWRSAIAKLKGAAEEAKTQLSTAESAEIDIDFLCQDDRGEPIEFHCTLTRRDFERAAEPIISRSIQICRSVLTQSKLMPHAIGKMILVGEATRMPYLRQRLEEELKIPLEFTIDPMTIVAKGAAVFASTQRLEPASNVLSVQREFSLVLEGKRVGPEQEPFVGGKVVGTNTGDLHNYTIEFINQTAAQSWRSGKITLSAEGAFLAALWAEKGLLNRFEIELCDAMGSLCNTTPNHWEYEVGAAPTDQSLFHSLSIATPDGSFYVFLRKGCVLPARCRSILYTRAPFTTGQSAPFLSLPLYEGEEPQADHNRHIGELQVSAEDIHQDLQTGTEVELTIEVDKSRLVRSMVFIPILDKEFSATIQFAPPPNLDEVHSKVKEERARFEHLRRVADEINCSEALAILENGQHSLQELDLTLQRARLDHAATRNYDTCLRRLRSTLDKVESIIQAQKQEREHLAEQTFLIDGLNALYGRNHMKEPSNEADNH